MKQQRQKRLKPGGELQMIDGLKAESPKIVRSEKAEESESFSLSILHFQFSITPPSSFPACGIPGECLP